MSDRTLTCRDCGQEFVFTQGEQEFYSQRGFSDPQRCGSCRQARKTQRASSGFGDSSYGGGNSYSSGGGYSDRGYSSSPRQLYPAVCSECGQATEVPFSPTPGKPVYCRDCFQARKVSSPRYDMY